MDRGVCECTRMCDYIRFSIIASFAQSLSLALSIFSLLSGPRSFKFAARLQFSNSFYTVVKLLIAKSSQIIILLTFVQYYTYVFCTIFTKIVITSWQCIYIYSHHHSRRLLRSLLFVSVRCDFPFIQRRGFSLSQRCTHHTFIPVR